MENIIIEDSEIFEVVKAYFANRGYKLLTIGNRKKLPRMVCSVEAFKAAVVPTETSPEKAEAARFEIRHGLDKLNLDWEKMSDEACCRFMEKQGYQWRDEQAGWFPF